MKPTTFSSSRRGSVTGIEIMPDAIRMVKLRMVGESKAQHEGSGYYPLDPEVAPGSPEFISSLRQALTEFGGINKNTAIWVVLASDRVKILHLKVPAIGQGRLGGAVYWALKREEPFGDRDTIVDFETEEPLAKTTPGDPMEVTGYLANRKEVENLEETFERAGYPLTGLLLPLPALRNLFRNGVIALPESPVLQVHIGTASSRVSVVDRGRAAMTRSIPIGLNTFAEALTQNLVPAPQPTQAAELVLGLDSENNGGGRWPPEAIFNALLPVLERISRQIERTLEYYRTTYKSPPVGEVFLDGSIGRVKRIVEFISNQVSAEVKTPDPYTWPGLEESEPFPVEGRSFYAQAFGAALADGDNTPNLLHTFRDKERERRGKRASQVIFGLFLLLVAGCGLFYAWQQSELRDLREERDRLAQSVAAGPPLNEATVMAALGEVRRSQEQTRAAARRHEAVALLGEIEALTPDHVRLIHVSTRFPTTPPHPVRIEGMVFGERAMLDTLLAVQAARFEQSRLLRGVRVEESSVRETGGEVGLRFVLTMETVKDDPTEETQ